MDASKITWNDKVTLIPHPEILPENKVTDDDLNEVKTVVNTNADLQMFHLDSDSYGIITDSSLIGKRIGSIDGIGPTIYFEGIDFQKEIGGDTIMNIPISGSPVPFEFLANSPFRIFPKKA